MVQEVPVISKRLMKNTVQDECSDAIRAVALTNVRAGITWYNGSYYLDRGHLSVLNI